MGLVKRTETAAVSNKKEKIKPVEKLTPIMQFESLEQTYECLKEWQPRLFLEDWTIKINLNVGEVNSKDCWALNEYIPELKDAVISFAVVSNGDLNRVTKYCAEKILIHELLHLKLRLAEGALKEKPEGFFFNSAEHTLIEDLAKSLIMAKYGLTFDFFKNF